MVGHFEELLARHKWLMPLSSKWLRPLDRRVHGVTSQRPDQGAYLPCRGCQERVCKRVGSRTSLALAAAADRTRATSKRRCLDCEGSGKE